MHKETIGMLRITPKWLEHPTHGPTQRRLTRQPHWPVGQSRTAVADLDSGLPVGFQPSPSQEKDTSTCHPLFSTKPSFFHSNPVACKVKKRHKWQLSPQDKMHPFGMPPRINILTFDRHLCFNAFATLIPLQFVHHGSLSR